METLGCVMHFPLERVLRAICYCIAKGISEILVVPSIITLLLLPAGVSASAVGAARPHGSRARHINDQSRGVEAVQKAGTCSSSSNSNSNNNSSSIYMYCIERYRHEPAVSATTRLWLAVE